MSFCVIWADTTRLTNEFLQSDAPDEEIVRIFKKYADPAPSSSQPAASAPVTIEQKVEQLTVSVPVEPQAPSTPSVPSDEDIKKSSVLSLSGFTSFLMSSDNMPFTEKQGKIWQDMTRPICEYYISSSHNTYLVGNQLMGDSTAEGYIRALLQGCRSVERKSCHRKNRLPSSKPANTYY